MVLTGLGFEKASWGKFSILLKVISSFSFNDHASLLNFQRRLGLESVYRHQILKEERKEDE